MDQLIVFISLSVALAMDAFAVSISLGAAGLAKQFTNRLKIGIAFGFFQGLLFLLGFLSYSLVNSFLSSLNLYLASGLLLLLGLKMLVEGFKKEDNKCPHQVCLGLDCDKTKCDRTGQVRFLSVRLLLLFAIATSIDAFAAGISFAIQYNSHEIIYLISGFTFVLSFIGAKFGNRLKYSIGSKSEVIGGAILVFLAVKPFL